jgi:hypothetical protein
LYFENMWFLSEWKGFIRLPSESYENAIGLQWVAVNATDSTGLPAPSNLWSEQPRVLTCVNQKWCWEEPKTIIPIQWYPEVCG